MMDASGTSGVASRNGGGRRAASIVCAVGLLALGGAGWSAREVSRAEPRPLSGEDRAAIEDALQLFVSLSVHLRASSGDSRYADRLPADPEVTDEIMGEVQYLARDRRVEIPRLVKLEVVEHRPSAGDGALVRTKEYWITREEGSERPPRSDVVLARYQLRRQQRGWQVVSWDVDLPGSPEGER